MPNPTPTPAGMTAEQAAQELRNIADWLNAQIRLSFCPENGPSPATAHDHEMEQAVSALIQIADRLSGMAAAAPDGWKLVPLKSTLDMDIAFCEAWFSKRRCIDDPEMDDAYAALIAAAPEVPGHG